MEAIPEAFIKPVMAISEHPALPVTAREVVPSDLAMEAIPEALIQPVVATEAISEHTALPVTAMEAVPKQPIVTATEAFSESLTNLIKSTRTVLWPQSMRFLKVSPQSPLRRRLLLYQLQTEWFLSPLQRKPFQSPLQREQFRNSLQRKQFNSLLQRKWFPSLLLRE